MPTTPTGVRPVPWESSVQPTAGAAAESAESLPALHRTLMVGWMGEMGLPVKGLLQGLQLELASSPLDSLPRRR
jgi:hypothetical protein